MVHAGTVIYGAKGDAEEKMAAMVAAGIHVYRTPAKFGETLLKALGKS